MKYIYNEISFLLENDIYRLHLTRECFNSDKEILLSAARIIDDMLSQNLQTTGYMNLENDINDIPAQDFLIYLEHKYQLNLAVRLCTDFETVLPLSITKEKYIPPTKDDECNTEVSILK